MYKYFKLDKKFNFIFKFNGELLELKGDDTFRLETSIADGFFLRKYKHLISDKKIIEIAEKDFKNGKTVELKKMKGEVVLNYFKAKKPFDAKYNGKTYELNKDQYFAVKEEIGKWFNNKYSNLIEQVEQEEFNKNAKPEARKIAERIGGVEKVEPVTTNENTKLETRTSGGIETVDGEKL